MWTNKTFLTLAVSRSICAIVCCAGCGSQDNQSTSATPIDASARIGPANVPGAMYGIRVNGTEANPTYGFVSPGGDTICCWPTITEAEAAAQSNLRQR